MPADIQEIGFVTIALTAIFGVLVSFFVIIFISFQKRLRKKQIESFKNILSAQEKERERIARDLHDQVGPLLSKLKLSFEIPDSHSISSEWNDFKTHGKQIIDTAIHDIRTTSYNLMPKVLHSSGLIEAVEDFCEMMTRGSDTEIRFTHENYPTGIRRESELNLYRILQEIINNALKYSGAKTIDVSFTSEDGRLILSVSDNGTGFKRNMPASGNIHGFGLQNIESRTRLLGGRFQLNSGPGQGTAYLLTFQVKELM